MEVQVMKNILGENEEIADNNKKMFDYARIYVLNLMGSPGAGKTCLLEKTIRNLKDKVRLAVIEGDLFTDKDAARIEKLGAPVVQINTVGGCHLDAAMVEKAANKLNLEELDLIIVENVGNLVCPAEFAVGEDEKAVVLSIAEGDDKPAKYPLIFKESAICLLNKVDLLEHCDFNMAEAKKDISALHPGMDTIEISCKKDTGIKEWCDWLVKRVEAKKGGAK